MTTRTLTAVFDDTASAERASRELAMKVAGVRGTIYSSSSDLSGMNDLGIPPSDRGSLDEALHRGSVVLSAEVPENEFGTAADVLEGCGAVDLDAREEEWRGQGWAGGTTASTASTGGSMGSATAGTRQAATGREESIPVVEEQLRVGKREVGHGRVRVRSYVVETPVQEQVTLHQEHVQVERRAVDRPVTDADRLFQDRTIEATERSEEAVVSKEARVTGEVVINKTSDDQTRTISDTVRRTEVEIEDERTNRTAGAGTSGTTTPKRNPGRGA